MLRNNYLFVFGGVLLAIIYCNISYINGEVDVDDGLSESDEVSLKLKIDELVELLNKQQDKIVKNEKEIANIERRDQSTLNELKATEQELSNVLTAQKQLEHEYGGLKERLKQLKDQNVNFESQKKKLIGSCSISDKGLCEIKTKVDEIDSETKSLREKYNDLLVESEKLASEYCIKLQKDIEAIEVKEKTKQEISEQEYFDWADRLEKLGEAVNDKGCPAEVKVFLKEYNHRHSTVIDTQAELEQRGLKALENRSNEFKRAAKESPFYSPNRIPSGALEKSNQRQSPLVRNKKPAGYKPFFVGPN